MKESLIKEVAKEPEVEKTTPILMGAVFDPNKGESGGVAGYFGIEPVSFKEMKPFLKFRQGGWFTDENAHEAVMGYEAAELEQREVGDLILMPEKNVQFKVVGVLERTGTQDDGTIFIPLKTAQKIFGKPDEITTIGIKVKKGVDSTRLEEKMYQLPDVQVVSLAQVKETIMKLISTAKVMVLSIAIIAILIAMVGVINTILTSVWERFQEIGILKTIGAMPWDIFKLIWIETLILCTTGGIVGVILALVLARVTDVMMRSLLPYAPGGGLVLIDLKLVMITLGGILCIGLLSGIYPAWKAGKIRPLEAIRGEAGR
jgi:putative ABC transport system permease protein